MRTLVLLFFNLLICQVSASEGVWLLVNTQAMRLEVKQGQRTVETFKNISIGRNGSGFKEHRGDDITPLGTYKIGWVNKKSPYNLFYGFNYPTLENAKKALSDGLISRQTFSKIKKAHLQNRLPPQNTPLGGRIGIHGIGRGSRKVHETMNWTHGCIALTNRQIQRLAKWIDTGTLVKVK